MAEIRVADLHAAVPSGHVLRGIDLAIPDHQLTVVLGPPSSGKSTLLRLIAGLEEADHGTIEIGGEVVNNAPPRDRDIALVLADYPLYPRMNVAANLGFGLRMRKHGQAYIDAQVRNVADRLGISSLLDRYPRQLSDHERQRVAIGRAIVRTPQALLLDEPLSTMTAPLREEIRGAIKRFHQETGVTMLYATRDPVDAMTLAEHIVVMREGLIEQDGTPLALFQHPATRFVAGLIGWPRMNFLNGTVERSPTGEALRLNGDGTRVPLPPRALPDNVGEGRQVILGVRPDHMMRAVRVSPPDGAFRHEATIELLQPIGARVQVVFRMAGEPVIAELNAHDASRPGDTVPIDINLKRAVIFDALTERAL
jgi:multiple sugar transport system ATP-binding protein